MQGRRWLLLMPVVAFVTACGSQSPQIVFDSTTSPPLTTTSTTVETTLAPRTSPPATSTPVTTVETVTPSTASDGHDTIPPSGVMPPTAVGPCDTAGCSGPQVILTATLTSVPQLGSDPVQGSGCGQPTEFGNTMPDGIFFGFATPDGDALQFDVACVYSGEDAVRKGADSPVPFYVVNRGDRKRRVPLATDFIYRQGVTSSDGSCVDVGPEANADWTQAAAGTASWIVIANGQATAAVALCPI